MGGRCYYIVTIVQLRLDSNKDNKDEDACFKERLNSNTSSGKILGWKQQR